MHSGPRLLLALVVALGTLAFVGRARAAVTPTAWLYTVGVGSDPMTYYGHAVACVSSDAVPEGRCYDFGIANGSAAGVIWDSIRGKPRFYAVAADRAAVLATFEAQERTIYEQALPLSPADAAKLGDTLEAAVRDAKPYWYHPYYDNCSTRVRDALDAAFEGRLRAGSVAPAGPPFRTLSEGGFSGRVLELAALAIFLGAPTDRIPGAWERMFLPDALREGVEARLGAKPAMIYERRAMVLPTSIHAGRAFLGCLGLLLGAAVLGCARRPGVRRTTVLAVAGVLLGLLGLAVDFAAIASAYPEMSHNWTLLVLVPSDLVLPLSPRWIVPYLRLRVAGLGVIAAASAAHVVQPLVVVALFAAAPLGAAWFVLARSRPSANGLEARVACW